MSEPIAFGYPDHLYLLPSWKCFEHTLELSTFTTQQHPRPSCWGSFYSCETYTHDIWGSWYTPSIQKGYWTYLLPSLWYIQTYSCIRPQSNTWYYWCQSGRGKMKFSGPSRGMYFLIPVFLRVIPWIPLVYVPLDFHNPLLQKPRLGPAQDVHFSYTHSHLSALQKRALIFSINFQFIFIFKKCITQFSHWIVSCTKMYYKNVLQLFIKGTCIFVAIELSTFSKMQNSIFIAQESS